MWQFFRIFSFSSSGKEMVVDPSRFPAARARRSPHFQLRNVLAPLMYPFG
jgi:hypothetical protein